MRYWKITGLNEGKEIKQFYVKSHSIPHDYLDVYGDAYLDVYGDASRQLFMGHGHYTTNNVWNR